MRRFIIFDILSILRLGQSLVGSRAPLSSHCPCGLLFRCIPEWRTKKQRLSWAACISVCAISFRLYIFYRSLSRSFSFLPIALSVRDKRFCRVIQIQTYRSERWYNMENVAQAIRINPPHYTGTRRSRMTRKEKKKKKSVSWRKAVSDKRGGKVSFCVPNPIIIFVSIVQ